jgi:hypothetical protein
LISDFNNSTQGSLREDPVNLALDAVGEISVVDFTAGAKLQGSLFKVNAAHGSRTLISDFNDSSKGPLGQPPFSAVFAPPVSTAPDTLQFSAAHYDLTEDAVSAIITVTRTGGSYGQVSAEYVTSDGPATEGADYTFNNGSVVVPDGDAMVKRFTAPIIDDGDIEGDETVNLPLTNPDSGTTLRSPTQAVVTIADK